MSAKKAHTSESKPTSERSFEALLAEIDTLVAKLESGSLPLEEALAAFERASLLSAEAQSLVEAAEIRLAKLVKRPSGLVELDMEEVEEDDDAGDDL